jgi:hypothetical protein
VRHLNTAEAATLLRGQQEQDPAASQIMALLDLVGRGVLAVSIPANSGVDDWSGPYLTSGRRQPVELDGPAVGWLADATKQLLLDPRMSRVADDGDRWLAVSRWARSPVPSLGDAVRWQRRAVQDPLVRLGLLRPPPRRLGGRRPPPTRSPAGETLVADWLVVPLEQRIGTSWVADPSVASTAIVEEWLALVGCPWVGSPEVEIPSRTAMGALVDAYRANYRQVGPNLGG